MILCGKVGHGTFFSCRNGDVTKDPEVLKLVNEQTKQWTEMVRRHRM